MITSRKNHRIIELSKLAAESIGGFAFAEGVHLCEEAFFNSDVEIAELCVSENFINTPTAENFLSAAKTRSIIITEMTADCYAKISQLQQPEGVAIIFRAPEISLSQLPKNSRWLIIAGVQDPGNAGALVRVAEATNIGACIFVESVNPLKSKFLRAAMGSSFRVPCLRATATEIINAAKNANITIIAAAKTTNSQDYREIKFPPQFALIVGGEGNGVPAEILAAAEKIIHLPMSGKVESLNVAVAAGIILYS